MLRQKRQKHKKQQATQLLQSSQLSEEVLLMLEAPPAPLTHARANAIADYLLPCATSATSASSQEPEAGPAYTSATPAAEVGTSNALSFRMSQPTPTMKDSGPAPHALLSSRCVIHRESCVSHTLWCTSINHQHRPACYSLPPQAAPNAMHSTFKME